MNQKFCLFILLCMTALLACTNPSAKKSAIDNARQELLKAFKEQKIEGVFDFKASQGDSLLNITFKNKGVGNIVQFNTPDSTLVLGYYLNKGNNARTSNIYSSQLVRHDSIISFEIRDLSNKVIEKKESHIPKDILKLHHFPPPPPPPCAVFNSFDDCLDNFYCTEFPELQCEANRTCETIITGVCCCLPDGTCAWFDFIRIEPTDPTCKFKLIRFDNPPVVKAQ